MLKASEARSITNSSQARFEKEVSFIEDGIKKMAEQGNNKFFTSPVPVELQERLRDELVLNGYTVRMEPATGITVEW